ncbi:mariner transposase [Plakobranchus ocellatus]|uniref:Mariner transposase n=1 Tax=Plakobranchus ocellatus TaxID=259542 RepID=A0AAV4ACU8_9GAST|nr:mariner transposase [Plakobranchus ocellatus]
MASANREKQYPLQLCFRQRNRSKNHTIESRHKPRAERKESSSIARYLSAIQAVKHGRIILAWHAMQMRMCFGSHFRLIMKVPTGTTVIAQYYKMVIQDKLRPAIRRKRLRQSGVLFNHDNVPVHTTRMAIEPLDEYEWSMLKHPSFSPELAPCDFWLFSEINDTFVVRDLSQRKTLF